MWDLIVSVPDHCLSFYFFILIYSLVSSTLCLLFVASVCHFMIDQNSLLSTHEGALYLSRLMTKPTK